MSRRLADERSRQSRKLSVNLATSWQTGHSPRPQTASALAGARAPSPFAAPSKKADNRSPFPASPPPLPCGPAPPSLPSPSRQPDQSPAPGRDNAGSGASPEPVHNVPSQPGHVPPSHVPGPSPGHLPGHFSREISAACPSSSPSSLPAIDHTVPAERVPPGNRPPAPPETSKVREAKPHAPPAQSPRWVPAGRSLREPGDAAHSLLLAAGSKESAVAGGSSGKGELEQDKHASTTRALWSRQCCHLGLQLLRDGDASGAHCQFSLSAQLDPFGAMVALYHRALLSLSHRRYADAVADLGAVVQHRCATPLFAPPASSSSPSQAPSPRHAMSSSPPSSYLSSTKAMNSFPGRSGSSGTGDARQSAASSFPDRSTGGGTALALASPCCCHLSTSLLQRAYLLLAYCHLVWDTHLGIQKELTTAPPAFGGAAPLLAPAGLSPLGGDGGGDGGGDTPERRAALGRALKVLASARSDPRLGQVGEEAEEVGGGKAAGTLGGCGRAHLSLAHALLLTQMGDLAEAATECQTFLSLVTSTEDPTMWPTPATVVDGEKNNQDKGRPTGGPFAGTGSASCTTPHQLGGCQAVGDILELDVAVMLTNATRPASSPPFTPVLQQRVRYLVTRHWDNPLVLVKCASLLLRVGQPQAALDVLDGRGGVLTGDSRGEDVPAHEHARCHRGEDCGDAYCQVCSRGGVGGYHHSTGAGGNGPSSGAYLLESLDRQGRGTPGSSISSPHTPSHYTPSPYRTSAAHATASPAYAGPPTVAMTPPPSHGTGPPGSADVTPPFRCPSWRNHEGTRAFLRGRALWSLGAAAAALAPLERAEASGAASCLPATLLLLGFVWFRLQHYDKAAAYLQRYRDIGGGGVSTQALPHGTDWRSPHGGSRAGRPGITNPGTRPDVVPLPSVAERFAGGVSLALVVARGVSSTQDRAVALWSDALASAARYGGAPSCLLHRAAARLLLPFRGCRTVPVPLPPSVDSCSRHPPRPCGTGPGSWLCASCRAAWDTDWSLPASQDVAAVLLAGSQRSRDGFGGDGIYGTEGGSRASPRNPLPSSGGGGGSGSARVGAGDAGGGGASGIISVSLSGGGASQGPGSQAARAEDNEPSEVSVPEVSLEQRAMAFFLRAVIRLLNKGLLGGSGIPPGGAPIENSSPSAPPASTLLTWEMRPVSPGHAPLGSWHGSIEDDERMSSAGIRDGHHLAAAGVGTLGRSGSVQGLDWRLSSVTGIRSPGSDASPSPRRRINSARSPSTARASIDSSTATGRRRTDTGPGPSGTTLGDALDWGLFVYHDTSPVGGGWEVGGQGRHQSPGEGGNLNPWGRRRSIESLGSTSPLDRSMASRVPTSPSKEHPRATSPLARDTPILQRPRVGMGGGGEERGIRGQADGREKGRGGHADAAVLVAPPPVMPTERFHAFAAAALSDMEEAVAHAPHVSLFLLGRGLVRVFAGDLAGAREDLANAVEGVGREIEQVNAAAAGGDVMAATAADSGPSKKGPGQGILHAEGGGSGGGRGGSGAVKMDRGRREDVSPDVVGGEDVYEDSFEEDKGPSSDGWGDGEGGQERKGVRISERIEYIAEPGSQGDASKSERQAKRQPVTASSNMIPSSSATGEHTPRKSKRRQAREALTTYNGQRRALWELQVAAREWLAYTLLASGRARAALKHQKAVFALVGSGPGGPLHYASNSTPGDSGGQRPGTAGARRRPATAGSGSNAATTAAVPVLRASIRPPTISKGSFRTQASASLGSSLASSLTVAGPQEGPVLVAPPPPTAASLREAQGAVCLADVSLAAVTESLSTNPIRASRAREASNPFVYALSLYEAASSFFSTRAGAGIASSPLQVAWAARASQGRARVYVCQGQLSRALSILRQALRGVVDVTDGSLAPRDKHDATKPVGKETAGQGTASKAGGGADRKLSTLSSLSSLSTTMVASKNPTSPRAPAAATATIVPGATGAPTLGATATATATATASTTGSNSAGVQPLHPLGAIFDLEVLHALRASMTPAQLEARLGSLRATAQRLAGCGASLGSQAGWLVHDSVFHGVHLAAYEAGAAMGAGRWDKALALLEQVSAVLYGDAKGGGGGSGRASPSPSPSSSLSPKERRSLRHRGKVRKGMRRTSVSAGSRLHGRLGAHDEGGPKMGWPGEGPRAAVRPPELLLLLAAASIMVARVREEEADTNAAAAAAAAANTDCGGGSPTTRVLRPQDGGQVAPGQRLHHAEALELLAEAAGVSEGSLRAELLLLKALVLVCDRRHEEAQEELSLAYSLCPDLMGRFFSGQHSLQFPSSTRWAGSTMVAVPSVQVIIGDQALQLVPTFGWLPFVSRPLPPSMEAPSLLRPTAFLCIPTLALPWAGQPRSTLADASGEM
eukprot:jgi/Mesvir1/11697/Mv00089-RA.1